MGRNPVTVPVRGNISIAGKAPCPVPNVKTNFSFKKTDDGSLLPTPQAQRLDNPYGSIIDDIEIPEMNTRSQAVSDYLKSPEFARLALEVTGGVAGAMFPPLMIARAATLVRPALQQAVTRMAGAGFGQASGAGVSQTFDPTFDSNDDFTEIASDISMPFLLANAIE